MVERSSLVRLEREFKIETDWRGFELHPEVPPNGIPVSGLFGDDRAASFMTYMAAFAERFDVPIDIPKRVPNTRRALAATELARDEGKLAPFRDAVMVAHWLEGLNIESDQTLRRIAADVGLAPESIVRAADDPGFIGRIDE